jgi:molybdate transport system substrate-binding protein
VAPLAAILTLLASAPAAADRIRVAVASNFAGAAQEIADRFESREGHEVVLSFGSTGMHYAQITHGAPFDAFLAADAWRPELLERDGLALPGSRFTYARGQLVLWSATAGLVDPEGRVLERGDFRRLAIANPELAPYGRSAREVLTALGLWDGLVDRLVRAENVGQAFQFVASGNAELGFVAYSQILQLAGSIGGSLWRVPEDLHSPIEQQAVLLSGSDPARAFLSFLRGDEALEIIGEAGYGAP